jgi:hypothetical protein
MNYEKIVIANIQTEEKENLDRSIIIISANSFVGLIDIVGVKTSQLGQSMKMNFKYSIEVNRLQYKNEKYIYLPRTDELLEIKNNTKAKEPFKMLLQVVNCCNPKIIAAIKQYLLEGVLTP